MSIVLDGTEGITFPNSTEQASAGQVLQVVQGNLNGAISTSSTSFVTTGLTATITPKFATSKILIICSLTNAYSGSSGTAVFFTPYRNGTNIAPSGSGTSQCLATIYSIGTGTISNEAFTYLDSPATTSATTYTIYYAVNQNTGYLNQNGVGSSIQLMEIAQ